DCDARGRLERFLAALRVSGVGWRGLTERLWRRRRRRRGSSRWRGLAGRRVLLVLLLRDLLLLFNLWLGEKILPAQQHNRGQRDGDKRILLVGHREPVLPLRPACTRSNAPSNSCAICANGRCSAARLPIST